MPKKTMVVKKRKVSKLGKGKIAKALGKILKLSSGPESVKSLISTF